ncbi:MAG: hypothetical protein QM626_12640 [Microbacterium sp.]|uniref:hypothetical protein n=1 Tax=Microbacterium sp. TaxID=51671 RepID=UPI0039E47867
MSAVRRFVGWGVAGAVAAVALTGCSAFSSGESDPTSIDVDAAWLDSGRLIGVVTWGSSSCVPVAGDATLADDGALAVTLDDPTASQACTADYTARVTLVSVPDGVDPAQGVDVRVSYGSGAGEAALAGAEGLAGPGGETDYQPSAGWTSQAGMFAYLTWGSSSCAPVVADVAATGDAQVTLTFVDPDADRVCTMDIAPRAGLAEVSGLTTPTGAQLVLSGDVFDAVTVPIVGEPVAASPSASPTATT